MGKYNYGSSNGNVIKTNTIAHCTIKLVDSNTFKNYYVSVLDNRYPLYYDSGLYNFFFDTILSAISFYNIVLNDMMHTNNVLRKRSYVKYIINKYNKKIK